MVEEEEVDGGEGARGGEAADRGVAGADYYLDDVREAREVDEYIRAIEALQQAAL